MVYRLKGPSGAGYYAPAPSWNSPIETKTQRGILVENAGNVPAGARAFVKLTGERTHRTSGLRAPAFGLAGGHPMLANCHDVACVCLAAVAIAADVYGPSGWLARTCKPR